MERKMEQAMKATPPEELYEYLMDLSIPKTEAEHYAADRIAELEAQLRQKDIQIEMHSDLSEHRQQKLEARLDAVTAKASSLSPVREQMTERISDFDLLDRLDAASRDEKLADGMLYRLAAERIAEFMGREVRYWHSIMKRTDGQGLSEHRQQKLAADREHIAELEATLKEKQE
jgi:hypothetical protein